MMLDLEFGRISVPLLRGGDHAHRLRVVAGGAGSFGGVRLAFDLIVDRLRDMAHGAVVGQDSAVAAISAEQSPPSGRWRSEGVTATEPGAGGGEACGAGVLQAAMATAAKASGADDFIFPPREAKDSSRSPRQGMRCVKRQSSPRRLAASRDQLAVSPRPAVSPTAGTVR